MAVSYSLSSSFSPTFLHNYPLHSSIPLLNLHSLPIIITPNSLLSLPRKSSNNPQQIHCTPKWRIRVSFFQSFLTKTQDSDSLTEELLEAISPLDRGAEATPDDQERVDKIASKLESINKVKEPLKSNLLNGKWELLYTTSKSILQTQRPKFLRANGKIYQAINIDTLRAQNMETWPFFNQATANLVPLSERRVAVKFDAFKIAGLIPINSRGSGRGQLEITYLDEELRISRGNEGNLFILKMVDVRLQGPCISLPLQIYSQKDSTYVGNSMGTQVK